MIIYKTKTPVAILFGVSLFFSTMLFGAKPVDLTQQNISTLNTFITSRNASYGAQSTGIQELSRQTDFNHTEHVRIQQTYQGYKVLGADAVVHIPNHEARFVLNKLDNLNNSKITMNGIFYQELQNDLKEAPSYIFQATYAKKAIEEAIQQYKQNQKMRITKPQSQVIVYVDSNNQAHWAFWVTFKVPSSMHGLPAAPNFILDATNFDIYQQWDGVKTITIPHKDTQKNHEDDLNNLNKSFLSTPKMGVELNVQGGGVGGNPRIGRLIYDGLPGHLPSLNLFRDVSTKTCYLTNQELNKEAIVVQKEIAWNNRVPSQFSCSEPDKGHGNVYWNGEFNAVNEGYSPENDAFYAGGIVRQMFMDWYHIPVLATSEGKPMTLFITTDTKDWLAQNMENAYWDGGAFLGNGRDHFYPWTSLGVVANVISFGFTEQHAHLSGIEADDIRGSFGDMTGQAAEYYYSGHNSWKVGAEISKTGTPFRDMSQLSSIKKDPKFYTPPFIFDYVFYVLSNSKNWDTKKAFDIMIHANRYYWTSGSSYSEAACGVLKSAKDYGYEIESARSAFNQAKIDTNNCVLN